MSESIVYQDPNAPTPTAVILRGFGGFTFDAIFEEEHNLELEVTDYPVETGVSLTDHSYMKPNKVTMTVGVTNHQLVPYDDGFGLYDGRINNAYRRLQLLMRSREPFDVQTGLQLYNNMICTNLSVTQNAGSANAVMFKAELREIVIVNTEVVTYPPRKKGKAANQAGKKKDSGEKQSAEVDDKKKGSVLKKLSGALKGTS